MRYFVIVLALLFFALTSLPAHADNLCWNGADYHTTASGGHEDSHVIVGTGGAISSFLPIHWCQSMVTNNTASTVYAMVFDSATLPGNGAKPVREWAVQTGSPTQGTYGYGIPFYSGFVIACSSTEGTLTVTTTNACNFGVTVTH